MIPVITHIPHCSLYIPEDLRASLKINNAELQREILLLTDWYVDELFSCIKRMGGAALVFPVSRLIVDAERFEDDEQEVLASRGMGVIHTCTSSGGKLRAAPSDRERQELLDRYYRPHHAALEHAAEACLKTFGRCLILDCHSFASSPLPFEFDQDPVRPDICIGADPFHTPGSLMECIEQQSRTFGWSVFRDKPYKGTLVPMAFHRSDKRLSSVMIELNRKLYLDERTGQPLRSFGKAQEKVEALLKRIVDNTQHLDAEPAENTSPEE